MRYRAITFQTSEARCSLSNLKFTKNNMWNQDDVDYIITLYYQSEHRQQQICDDIDLMEKKIDERNLKKRI